MVYAGDLRERFLLRTKTRKEALGGCARVWGRGRMTREVLGGEVHRIFLRDGGGTASSGERSRAAWGRDCVGELVKLERESMPRYRNKQSLIWWSK